MRVSLCCYYSKMKFGHFHDIFPKMTFWICRHRNIIISSSKPISGQRAMLLSYPSTHYFNLCCILSSMHPSNRLCWIRMFCCRIDIIYLRFSSRRRGRWFYAVARLIPRGVYPSGGSSYAAPAWDFLLPLVLLSVFRFLLFLPADGPPCVPAWLLGLSRNSICIGCSSISRSRWPCLLVLDPALRFFGKNLCFRPW